MNKDQIKRNVGVRVELLPNACLLNQHGLEVCRIEEDWIIEDVADDGVTILSPTTGHKKTLGYDHIYKFTTNGVENGVRRGFLSLHVQVFVQGNEVSVLPNARPGEPVHSRDPDPVETVATRFVRLFEAHGVHRNQISRVFGHGLAPVHFESDTALMPVLTDAMLDAAARQFAICREWLDGASDQIYPLHDFYKKPEEFIKFITGLRRQCKGDIRGVVLVATSKEFEETALVILEQEIGFVGERPFCRYHLCNNWIFAYWKARAYLTACVALAWNAKANLLGRRVPIELIRKYKEGTYFLEYELDGALPTGGLLWYPEDMAVNPQSFLDGLDEGEFGIREGLSLWLQLDAVGLMKTDLPYANVRQAFERVLTNSPSS
jgi:hypothetical protein